MSIRKAPLYSFLRRGHGDGGAELFSLVPGDDRWE